MTPVGPGGMEITKSAVGAEAFFRTRGLDTSRFRLFFETSGMSADYDQTEIGKIINNGRAGGPCCCWFPIPANGIALLGGGGGTITDMAGNNIAFSSRAARLRPAPHQGFIHDRGGLGRARPTSTRHVSSPFSICSWRNPERMTHRVHIIIIASELVEKRETIRKIHRDGVRERFPRGVHGSQCPACPRGGGGGGRDGRGGWIGIGGGGGDQNRRQVLRDFPTPLPRSVQKRQYAKLTKIIPACGNKIKTNFRFDMVIMVPHQL